MGRWSAVQSAHNLTLFFPSRAAKEKNFLSHNLEACAIIQFPKSAFPAVGVRLRPFDSKGCFASRLDLDRTRHLAVRGAGFTLLSGGLGFGVQIVSTVVLARLLSPADFGLVAMVTTFILLLNNFGLNGFTEAIQQREEINKANQNNIIMVEVT